ncbi:MAG: PQQ-dependent sugar dehydrogenase [Bradymonadia bacterium]
MSALWGCDPASPPERPFTPIGRPADAAVAQPVITEIAASSRLQLKFVPVRHDAGVTRLTDIAFLPENGELLVTDKSGQVVHLRLEKGRMKTLGQFVVPGVYNVLDAGLVSLAIDPDFTFNRFFYLGLSFDVESSVIRRYTLHAGDPEATLASAVDIMELRGEGALYPWHNVGSLGFTEDGAMWALSGDKVLGAPAQDITSPLGALLRFFPGHGPEGGWSPHPENPYAHGDGHPAVYAVGMRSPWKGAYHEGIWFFGDVGQSRYEELNRVTYPGQNFGWPDAEGPCRRNCAGFTDPLSWYTRGAKEAFVKADRRASSTRQRSVYVGLVYPEADAEGPPDRYDGLWHDVIVYGDAFTGFVRGRAAHGPPGRGADRDWAVGHVPMATGWAVGPDGYVYVSALGSWPEPARLKRARIYRAELKSAK